MLVRGSFSYCVSSLLLRVKYLCNTKDGDLHDLNPLKLEITQHFLYTNRLKVYEYIEQFLRLQLLYYFNFLTQLLNMSSQ